MRYDLLRPRISACGHVRGVGRPISKWPSSATDAEGGRRCRLCHGVCVDEHLWDAYDRMGVSFAEHAADSAYNAHYDRPAVLAALGPVTGRRVLDAALSLIHI